MHVAIVGAGPAGAWAAYQLAQRGARVTIFDHSHPREKPCGGGVTGRALALVAGALPDVAARGVLRPGGAAGVGDELPFAVATIRTARFTDSVKNTQAIVPLAEGALLVASRAAFDAALLNAAVRAGASLKTARVVDVTIGASSVDVRTREAAWSADFLIGADGANSIVRRRAGRRFSRQQLSMATGFFAQGVTSDEIVVEMVADPPGYIWSFPRPDHLAIGICAQADAGAPPEALWARAAAWVRARGLADGAPLTRYSWPIPSLGSRDLASQEIAGPRWCLVGDAAGLVDPITREGIYFALASAEWAADAITARGDPACAYRARVRTEAVSELSRAARLKAGFFRPSFTALMVDALAHSAAIRAAMADLIAGTQTYRTLKWRLLRTFELGFARALYASAWTRTA
jgi:geranylgeranyl reductase family protein